MSMLRDVPVHCLPPSPEMEGVLAHLRESLARLGETKAKTTTRIWDNIPVCSISKAIAAYSLWQDGYDLGTVPADDAQVLNDIAHRLGSDYEIMCADDLKASFTRILNGATVTSTFRKISEASDVSKLFKDTRAIGWQGFKVVSMSKSERQIIRTRRMFVDNFRRDFNWTRLRAVELSEAAALIEYALLTELLSPEDSESFARRVVTEAMTRYASWNAFAKSLLTASVFLGLENGEANAVTRMQTTLARLEALLAGPWQDTPWPRLAKITDGPIE